jgi:hypothetical protein
VHAMLKMKEYIHKYIYIEREREREDRERERRDGGEIESDVASMFLYRKKFSSDTEENFTKLDTACCIKICWILKICLHRLYQTLWL